MYNLVIVASPSLGDPVPFMRLGRYVSEADRAIRVHVLIDGVVGRGTRVRLAEVLQLTPLVTCS